MLPKYNATMLLIIIRTSKAFQIDKKASKILEDCSNHRRLYIWFLKWADNSADRKIRVHQMGIHTFTWKSEKIKKMFRTVCAAETVSCSSESMTNSDRVSWSWAELRPGTPAGFCLFLFLEPAALSYLTCSHIDIFGVWNFQPFSFCVQVQPPRQAHPTILIGPGRKCKDLSICFKLEGNQIFESFLKMELLFFLPRLKCWMTC